MASARTAGPTTSAAATSVLVAYAATSALEVVGEVGEARALIVVTKLLLMPLLLAWLLLVARRPLQRPLRALALALVFAWLGDLALLGSGDAAFVAGMVMFLVMQVLYIRAFRLVPGPGLVRAWPLAVVPYALAWAVLSAVMLWHSGAAALPGLVYGLALVAMAVSALDLVIRVRPQSAGWRVAAGAAAFVISDGILALVAFAGVPASRWLSALVMVTYVVAQAMIVTGLTRALSSQESAQAV